MFPGLLSDTLELGAELQPQSMCAKAADQEQPLSPDTFRCGITLASDWFEHVITSSVAVLPTFYLY